MQNKAAFIITALLGALALAFIFYSIINPDMYRKMNPVQPIGYVFVPDDDEFEGRTHLMLLSVVPFKDVTIETVIAHFKKKMEMNYQQASFYQIGEGSNWAVEIPSLQKGERYFYYIEINYKEGSQTTIVRIPEWAPQKPLPYVTYEGRPKKLLVVIHVVMVLGAAILLLHGLYYALVFLQTRSDNRMLSSVFKKTYSIVLWSWISFTFSTLIIGYYIAYVVFGTGWNGIPFGDDITDNKSLFVVLYWGILLFLRSGDRLTISPFKNRISKRTFCTWLIVGILLTALVYFIPHSLFFQ
ncbi:MAG: hypothetical protein A2Y62_17100 [Candidatus Fischerbacteria bacterium RBG_13_37_8]|uniref:Uncharacterized protein n=1 Tax=Candidatus Fischerbacteria bacterium RBG_13_37_8 TaxID=1817863 RepID=A0A1F5VG33_9BACT|nr:MAG: hypothetical protein A2Y62_17100 [Candidatus Fischerbacteria bacterium RBG_13_37_8]